MTPTIESEGPVNMLLNKRRLNICLIGAGRRYSLVERFQNAGFNVCAVEKDRDVPISKLCRIYTELYQIPHTTLAIPLMDKLCYEYASIQNVLTSCKSTNEVCYDKFKFEEFMEAYFPDIYPSFREVEGQKMETRIQKLRFGNGSNGIHISDYDDGPHIHNGDDIVEQRYIKGVEYSVDCYFDKNHNFVGGLARSRDRVAGGEVVDSTIVHKPELVRLCKDISVKLKFTGPTNFQFIIEESSQKPYIIEINARFGGGCILSLEAGLDMIQFIKDEYFLNQPIHKWAYKPLKMRRVFKETFFNVNE